MKLLKDALFWTGILFVVLTVLFCFDGVFDSHSQEDALKVVALAATSIACLQAAQALKDKE